jgi:small subunit ribosomal protein S20
LANIKSAIKRNKQNEKRRLRNRIYRGRARTYIRRANLAIQNGDKETAQVAMKLAVSALDKAAEKKILHINNVSRRKSRLMKKFASMEQ